MIVKKFVESTVHPPAPDVYFSAEYAAACEQETSGKWMNLSDPTGDWQLPVVLTPISGAPGRFDAASPYGYAGVFATAGMPIELQRQLWMESIAALRASGVVSLFLRHSSLVSTMDRAVAGEHEQVVTGHPTVVVDIGTEEDMWTVLEGRTRTAVRKARKSGLDVRVRPMSSRDCADGSRFRELYESTMARVGAAERYHFSRYYYEALLSGLGHDVLVVEVYDSHDTVGSAALLMRSGKLLHYHLSGSDPGQARLGANNLLLWGAMAWAAENSLVRFHLGGGVSSDDQLLRFKRSFGGRELTYAATGHVVDPQAYTDLVARAKLVDLRESCFPAYRGSDS